MIHIELGKACEHGYLDRQCEICKRDTEIVKLRSKLEEAERKLAQARADGMEEAMAVVKGCMADNKKTGRYIIGWNDAVLFAITNIHVRIGQKPDTE